MAVESDVDTHPHNTPHPRLAQAIMVGIGLVPKFGSGALAVDR
jgi:hypothetical protein